MIWTEVEPHLAKLPGTGTAIAAYNAAIDAAAQNADYNTQVVLAPDPSTLTSDPRFGALRVAEDANAPPSPTSSTSPRRRSPSSNRPTTRATGCRRSGTSVSPGRSS